MLGEIETQARRAGVSRSAFLSRLLKYGLEAEQQKRDYFAQKIRQYRECPDANEAERLENEPWRDDLRSVKRPELVIIEICKFALGMSCQTSDVHSRARYSYAFSQVTVTPFFNATVD